MNWESLPDELQLLLSHEAMRRATEIVADQAEQLAREMLAGSLRDRGGPDALRLLAALLRATVGEGFGIAGNA